MDNIELSMRGFVVGDALGVPVEFKNRDELKRTPLSDMIGWGSHNVPEGCWSDDTSLVLATAQSISENKSIDYNDIMNKFVEWYKYAKFTATDKVFDVGNTTYSAINNYINGVAPLKCGESSEWSNGNGSLMRMLPIALYAYYNNLDEDTTVTLVNDVSSLTHQHEISRFGCLLYTDYLLSLLTGSSKEQALEQVKQIDYARFYSQKTLKKYERIINGTITTLNCDQIKSSGFVVDTLEASIWSLMKSSSYEEAVLTAINLGDDTDTIGAITGSLAAVTYKYIPLKWTDVIKNKTGLDQVIFDFKDTLYYLQNQTEKGTNSKK